MSKLRFVFVLVLISFFALTMIASCADDEGDDDDSGDDPLDDDIGDDDTEDDDDESDDDDDNEPPPGCDTLVQGWNEDFVVNGVSRSFFLDLPDDVEDSWPWPVVFNWHGFGESARFSRRLVKDQVNREDFPFIAVTVDDTGLMFDWDIIDATAADNREILFFDALLDELDICFGVDPDHIHTMGFSLGGATSDMLGTTRGEIIASIATCSGAYANNPANWLADSLTKWPEFNVANKYTELRLHGGILDNNILPFGQYGENDLVFLNDAGHDWVKCMHPGMHNMGFILMNSSHFITFFRDHPLGTVDSPYAYGLPEEFPDICSFSPKH